MKGAEKMDIRHLEYFFEVAKHLNFTKAASALHLSQPSLSKTIKNMESELGVNLFYRSYRQLELTDAGKALLQNTKNVLHAYHHLTSELNDVMELKKGEIRIGVPPIIGAAYCSELISHFIDLFPLINITLTEVGTKKIKHGIDDGTLDVGFVCNRPNQTANIDMIQLVSDRLLLVVHNTHRLHNKSAVHFSEIAEEAFVMYRQDFSLYDSILEECALNHFFPNIVCESSQKDFIIEMVAAKLGVALLPSKICNQINNDEIVSIPLQHSSLHLELGMIWKKDNYIPFAVREFISLAENYSINSKTDS